MRNYTFTENGFTFKRINKAQAKRAYNNGLTVRFCPVNLRPGSPFRLDMDMNKVQQNCAGVDFEQLVNAFEFYNCRSNETGKYTAFYIPVETVDRFTGEKPTAGTLGTVEQYAYSYMEGLKMTDYNKIAMDNLNALMREIAEYSRMAEEIGETLDSLKDSLKKYMEENGLDTIAGSEHKASYKAVTSSRIDTTALKRDMPEIAARYTKTTETRRFLFV